MIETSCKKCAFSVPVFFENEEGERILVERECHHNAPTHEGWPVVPLDSWCGDGVSR